MRDELFDIVVWQDAQYEYKEINPPPKFYNARLEPVKLLVLDVDGVLTDGRLYFDNQGKELKAFSTRDGLGMRALQSQGTLLALITGRRSEIVARRAANLGIEHVYQGRDDKLDAFNELLGATGLEEREVCYAGDDWIDIPVLDRVGLAVTVPDADSVVKDHAHWITPRPGGHGAGRHGAGDPGRRAADRPDPRCAR